MLYLEASISSFFITSYKKIGKTIGVRNAEESSHQIIAHASQLQTGSVSIVNAQKIVVSDVINIGLSLDRPALITASSSFSQDFVKIWMYSISKIEFPTTIPINAIMPIIDVALKYSPVKR